MVFFKKLTILTLLLMLNGFAGTTGKIAGVVQDAETGEPLPGVNVVISGTSMGAATNVEGRYFIINIPPGEYEVHASMMGYQQVTKTNVIVKIDITTDVNFSLKQSSIEGEEVTVVAERPIIELDLTSTKQVMSAEEFSNSWVNSVEDALEMQSGVNIHGGVRGGFGLDVTYVVDGMEIREGGSNSNFMVSNTSAIQELEVLTGGYNAEYGRANGAIINIVTKSARDRWHGSLNARMRPAGKYHWGRNIYSKDNFEWQVIGPEYFQENGGGERWTSYWTEQLGQEPDADFNWQKYQEIMTPDDVLANYAERNQYEVEGTLYGPITSKLDVMLSGRFFNRVNKYPSVLAYNPEWNGMAKLSYDLADNTTLRLQAMHQGTNNTGDPKLSYGSSQDLVQHGGATVPSEIRSPFAPYKWFPAGAKYIYAGRQTIFPPQYIRNTSVQAKLTHIFSPRTFLEVSLSHFNLTQDVDYRRDNLWYLSHLDYQTAQTDPDYLAPFWFDDLPHSLEPTYQPGDLITFDSKSRALTLKADFTSQITDHHLLKTGLEVSPQYSEQVTHSAGERNVVVNDWMDPGFHPWEAAAYFQDKIEVQGMVINAGVRVDAYNVNKNVNYTIFDPAGISDITDGNEGIGVISFDPDGEYAVQPKTQVAVSPRLGISHPITESTVLHFMYGHFNQRPSWQQLGGLPMMMNEPVDERWEFPLLQTFPEGALVSYNFWTNQTGNPGLTFQRMIQYEVGFDQNIANLARLDITLYYKAGTGLTNVGFLQGTESYGTSNELRANIWPDPYNHLNTTPGQGLGRFFIPINGGRLDARGLEFTLDSNFSSFLKMRAIYNMSWVTTGRYGPRMIFIPRPEQNYTKVEPDDYYGGDENLNERWNPTHTLRFNMNISTPERFGPAFGNFFPLGLWNLDIYHQYASAERFTYHSVEQGDFSSEPNNRRWKAHNKTNMRLAKRFNLIGNVKTVLSVDVINLFNNRVLRLMPEGSNELKQYMENGELPQVKLTYQKKDPETGEWESAEWVETDEWSIYSRDLMPREVFFGIGFEF